LNNIADTPPSYGVANLNRVHRWRKSIHFWILSKKKSRKTRMNIVYFLLPVIVISQKIIGPHRYKLNTIRVSFERNRFGPWSTSGRPVQPVENEQMGPRVAIGHCPRTSPRHSAEKQPSRQCRRRRCSRRCRRKT